MKVRVTLGTGTFIILELEGFQPVEHLTFLFTGEIPGTSSSRLESRPTAAVGEGGRFTWNVGLEGIPQKFFTIALNYFWRCNDTS
jgi:hypothetical protein